jgi:hypothetical protein
MPNSTVCELAAAGSQYAGAVSIALYVAIFAMLARARDPKALLSLLIIAPAAMVVIRVPAIVTLLRTNLTSGNAYVVAYSVASNVALSNVYAQRPGVAMAICATNAALLAWVVLRTDRYDKNRLISRCESVMVI